MRKCNEYNLIYFVTKHNVCYALYLSQSATTHRALYVSKLISSRYIFRALLLNRTVTFANAFVMNTRMNRYSLFVFLILEIVLLSISSSKFLMLYILLSPMF